MKDYKRIAIDLCNGFMDMPCGCDGCPLAETGEVDEDGNMICELYDREVSE